MSTSQDTTPGTDELMRMAPVIPVLVIDDPAHARPLAEALVAGGLPVLEVTLRTPAALAAVEAMAAVPGAVVGVGTVIEPGQFAQSLDAGARFAVTPGLSPALIEAARAYTGRLPLLPGVMTPSELLSAREAGFDRLKFFPAGPAGGVKMLAAFGGPFQDVKFCPTGGVSRENMGEYLALPNVVCVGGSWVAPRQMMLDGDWSGIEALAREAAGDRGG